MVAFLAAVAAYLVGSIPFAVIVSRAMGLPDPRSFGSGNPGATNVLRSGSKAAAVLTLAGDALKGWVPVWAAYRLGLAPEVVAVVALAAFLGHVFPVWLALQGRQGGRHGRGRRAGDRLARRRSPCSPPGWPSSPRPATRPWARITAALLSPVVTWYFLGAGPVFIATCAMCAVLVWRHEANIRKLLRGEESRIGEKRAAT